MANTNISLYTRVSKSDDSQSTDRQISELRDFAKSQGWIIVEEITENISDRRVRRKGTIQLINLAKANRIQKVLIHEISRLGRNIADVFHTIEELTKYKVSVYDYSQKQETLDENNQKTTFANLILPILAGMSEEWVKQHSYRIKSGLKEALKKEDEILKLMKLGYIPNNYGKHIKATHPKIAKYVGVSLGTVKKVWGKRKNEFNNS